MVYVELLCLGTSNWNSATTHVLYLFSSIQYGLAKTFCFHNVLMLLFSISCCADVSDIC